MAEVQQVEVNSASHMRNQARVKRDEEELRELMKQAGLAQEDETQEEATDSESDSEGVENAPVQDASVSEQKEKEPAKAEAQEADDTELTAEEKTFKKRYGDLRRHMQEKEKEWNNRLESLEKRKAKDSIVPPKSSEDIEEWAKKYPDVAGIVEKIASEKAKEMFSKAEERLKELDEAHNEALRMKAENVIRKSHDDFDELRQSEDFHNWAEEQPKWVKDALYENMDDPASVIRVIDLYKVDNDLTPAAKRNTKKAAASTVSKGTRTSIDAKGVSGQIKESDVARMSAKEFEARQDDISEAMRSGKFIYDISGAAR